MPRFRTLGLLTALAFSAAPAAGQTAPVPMVEQIRGLRLDSLAGPLPVHYSAGFRDHAEEVQAILRDAARFYADSLGLPTTVRVALLAAPQWQRVTQVPYGVPFTQGGVVLIPATGDGAIAADFLSLEAGASAEARAKVAESGASFAENARRMTDLIGYHELGHGYTSALGIRPHTRWFSELLATYMAYAFLARARPQLARGWEAMLLARLQGPRPAHTSLADFERLYIRVGPENYNWYQAAFAMQAAEVFQAQGLGFLARVREAFPAGGEQMDGDAVLARLEAIHPGFRAWADRLGAPAAP
jgi:hypothetical protein